MTVRARILCLLALAALFAVAGCGGDGVTLPAEKDEPLYREGQQLARQDRMEQSLVAYLKLIAKRGDDQAPESHLEVGLIFLDNFKNQIYAIYHLERYLELEPNSPLAHKVRDEIDRAKREFARTLPGDPLENQAGRMDANDELAALRNENNLLKAEISTLRNSLGSGVGRISPAAAGYGSTAIAVAPAATAELPAATAAADETAAPPISRVATPTPAPAPGVPAVPARPGGRTHVVVKGDSLYNLALRYYGSGSAVHQHAIVEANRNLLESEKSTLKLGMDLKIP